MEPEQPELDLEYHTSDHYTIELLRQGVNEYQVLRKHTANSSADAITLIEGLRTAVAERDDVTWQAEEVNAKGLLYGLAPGIGGSVGYLISVVPPLTEEAG